MTRKIQLFLCLITMLCSGEAFAASPAAYVYVQQPVQGDIYSAPIFAYAAASDGKLTPIKGSPFTQTTGTIVGTNGTRFITLFPEPGEPDDAVINSYAVASDGVIGERAVESALGCGGVIPQAELDHSGKYVRVACASGLFKFSTSTLVFQSSIAEPSDPGSWFTLPTFTGTAEIPVGVYYNPEGFSCTPIFYAGSDGPAVETSPQPAPPGYGYYAPTGPITNDPTDHLAVAMVPVAAPYFSCGSYGPTQLASYLVNNSGADIGVTTGNRGGTCPRCRAVFAVWS